MRYKTSIKGMLALALCAALALGMLAGCENTATTMQLEKTQGAVGVTDEKEKRIEPREGMQLYSGYQVGTASASQAWISLDDAKAVKLAATSTARILQSGKKLTVKLHEGKLFFDVSKPLEAEETFTIETATMVTGIRGTSGWLEVVDEFTTRLTVLEGTVTVETVDPETGEVRRIAITGGQIITVVYYGSGQNQRSEDDAILGLISDNVIISGNIIYSATGLRVEMLQEEHIPDFVREEIAAAPALQERITEKSDLSVPDILDTWEPPAEQPTAGSEDSQLSSEPTADPAEESVPLETEIYYEKITVEWTEAVEVYPTTGTEPQDPTTGTGPGSSEPSTDPEVAPGETTGPEIMITTQYRPQIQFFPSDSNPTYAVITQANEVTTLEVTRDAVTGEVVSSRLIKTEILEVAGAEQQTDDVTDGEVTFKDLDGNTVTLPVTSYNPPT